MPWLSSVLLIPARPHCHLSPDQATTTQLQYWARLAMLFRQAEWQQPDQLVTEFPLPWLSAVKMFLGNLPSNPM